MIAIERPLALGEVLAETLRLYGERIWSALGLGEVTACSFLVASLAPPAAGVAIVALAFTATYAAAARVIAGDGFREAWSQVVLRLPVLLILTFVASLPFALALGQLLLLLFAVAWLALSGFSIPVAMVEREREAGGWLAPLGFSLHRSIALARAEYLHAAGVIAALVVIYILVGAILGAALVGFAENGRFAALALVQVVLAPFFFFGLSVLYFEQRARAISSAGRER